MKKLSLIFVWLFSLLGATQVNADELTVNNGTSTNQYVPFYGYYGDAYTKCEFIIPAADLAEMTGKNITAMKFYSNLASQNWNGTFQVFLKEVEGTTMTAYMGTEGATIVFEGTGLANDNNKELAVIFTNGYTYNGGNLLVGFYQIEKGNYKSVSFYGVNQDNITARQGHSTSSFSSVTDNARYFLPKTTFTYEAVAEGAAVTLFSPENKKMADGDNYDFGLIKAATTKTFVLKNTGTEDVEISFFGEGAFTSNLTANTTIAVGESLNWEITLPIDNIGTQTGVKGFNLNGTETSINLSGTVLDPNKIFIDFADGTMPEGWSSVKIGDYGNGWVAAEGYAYHSNSATSYYLAALTSPLVSFTAGEKLFFDVSRYGSATYNTSMVKLQKSTDGTTWEDVYTVPDGDLVYEQWKTESVSMPEGNYYIRFYGGYANITNIYGGELPIVAIMKAEVEDCNFGFVTSTPDSKTFVIKNTGRAELTGLTAELTEGEGFTVSVNSLIAAGEQTTLSVSLTSTMPGLHEGTVTVSADNQESVTFNVSAYMGDGDKLLITFDDNKAPENWENTGWTFANGVATGNYTSSTSSRNSEIITPAIEVGEGETMAIEAMGTSSYAELYVYTSADGGTTWTKVGDFNTLMRANTTDYTVAVLSGLDAGTYKFKFEGYAVKVNTINGFQYDQNAPAMTVAPAEDAAFGKVTANATKTYAVSNTGTGELTVNLASDSEDFSVEPAQIVVAAGEDPVEFTVTFNFNAESLGEKSGNITLTPTYDETAVVTIAASAVAKDPNAWDEDFAIGTLPIGWEANNWTVGTFSSYENTTSMALAPSSSTPGTLITPPLEAKANDVLTWDAYLNWSDEALIIEYSADEKTTWTQIYNYKAEDDGVSTRYSHKPMSFTAPADGTYYLRFISTYQNGVDNFNGFKLALKEHDASVTATNIPVTGDQYVAYTATVTVKEMAGKEETLTAKFFIGETQYGEDVVETVAANGTKTFTVTFTPEEAVSGDAFFTLTNDDLTIESDKVAVEIAAAPVLDEANGSLEGFEYFGNYPAIKLNYSLKAGWNTIVLPFAVSDLSVFGEGAKAYQFNGFADNAIQFSVVESLNAQEPYVLYATAAMSSIVFKNVTNFRTSTESADINKVYNDATFQGTYTPVTAGSMSDVNWYGVVPTSGKIQKAGSGASLKGFRAYFVLPESANANNIIVRYGSDLATSIEAASMLNELNGEIYDLQGRKVNKAQKGLYIQNGKKYVVK